MVSATTAEKVPVKVVVPKTTTTAADDDFDLFDSDEEEEAEEQKRIREVISINFILIFFLILGAFSRLRCQKIKETRSNCKVICYFGCKAMG